MSQATWNRRDFLKAAGFGTLGLSIPAAQGTGRPSGREDRAFLVYVGTYTSGESEGIYLYRLDLSSGMLTHVETIGGVVNPSFLAIDPRRRYLYAVNEVGEFEGNPVGAVSAFSIDQQTGGLTFLNQQPTGGGAPCHLVADAAGQFVLVANYSGGNVCVLPVQADGRLGKATDLVQHEGASVNPQRQERPHAHCILLDAANRYAFSADLGIDKVMIYRFDGGAGKLVPNEQPWVQVAPGAGPRHFTFHPNGGNAYVINELNATVTVFAYDAARGTLEEVQTVPTLPEGFSGTSYCADIHVAPSGRFVYGSNRGHDSIVIFAVDEATGRLTQVGHAPTQGKTPRNFAIDPTGTFLLAANQGSDTVVSFRIDPETGLLTPTGHVAEVPTPVCLKLIPPFA